MTARFALRIFFGDYQCENIGARSPGLRDGAFVGVFQVFGERRSVGGDEADINAFRLPNVPDVFAGLNVIFFECVHNDQLDFY